MDYIQPDLNPTQQFGLDEEQPLLFSGYSDEPGSGTENGEPVASGSAATEKSISDKETFNYQHSFNSFGILEV